MKAFIISLSKIPSSAETGQRVLDNLKQFGLDAELFEGTYGHHTQEIFAKEVRELSPTSQKGHPVDDSYRELASRPGVMGCFHSHYRLWQKCLELNEPILIFEDDVIFERGFIPVEWSDVLLLATGKDRWTHDFFKEKLFNPQGKPEAVKLIGKTMPGAVGYGLTPNGAAKLVERYNHYYLPADNAMNTRVVYLQCHNYLMGRAAVGIDGKKSLTKTKMWHKLRLANNSLDDGS